MFMGSMLGLGIGSPIFFTRLSESDCKTQIRTPFAPFLAISKDFWTLFEVFWNWLWKWANWKARN